MHSSNAFDALIACRARLWYSRFADQMLLIFPETTATALANTFNLAFPIGGFVTSGIIGLFVGAVILVLFYELVMVWLDRSGEREPPPEPA